MTCEKSHALLPARLSHVQDAVITPLPIPVFLHSHRLHVLVAEDDIINSQVLEKYLENLGHTVVRTTNGEECATMFASGSHTFDVVLTDIQMPIMDGFAATKSIRDFEAKAMCALKDSAENSQNTPTFAVSSTLMESDKDRCLEAGLDGWIIKPIDPARLALLLRGVVDHNARKICTHKSGHWDLAGWFEHVAARYAF